MKLPPAENHLRRLLYHQCHSAVLRCLLDEYGVSSGHVETVHAYTNDQNLIDNYHSGDRRGRSAALNMVLTSTGAAKAVAKAIPN